ncbi:unnamed protein product [Pleuronectes platessa]|uniref:Uncharacterized protein n=1 Tax=Pleuronectes platessa TaxID=8262 RepID=A0A9N7Z2T5_PLEPL|nr:unnamed protein product [Pleuronectes platessa]
MHHYDEGRIGPEGLLFSLLCPRLPLLFCQMPCGRTVDGFSPWSATSRTTIHHPDQNATPVLSHRSPPRAAAAVLVKCPYPMPMRHRVRHHDQPTRHRIRHTGSTITTPEYGMY